MKLLVYLRDGRTVFQIVGRGQLRKLVQSEPFHENEAVTVVRGMWNPTTGEYVWQPGINLRHLAKGSISSVEEGTWRDAKDGGS